MRSTGLFAGIHLAGNALLLWLGYYWLGLGEARAGALLWSLAVAALVVCGACWLYGAGFAFFVQHRIGAAFRAALRRLAPLVAAAIGVVVVYALLMQTRDAMDNPGFRLASWLTLHLRRPVKPATVQAVFHGVFWVLRWIVAPVLILPIGPAIVSRGWAGFGAVASRCRVWLYWLEAPALLLAAVWAPLKLVGWAPHMSSFGGEMTSFVVRAAVAYLLFAAGWLGLAFVTARE
ncbi:MAG TPA: hypothetical protein VKF41_06890 [Bryobacteraceae bacterium]|nr:hypothetical protein [Bryobacteraceae bacterium]